MTIAYYGASCFKVQSGETVIVFNPPSKESEYKSPRFGADIVLISINHKDYNGWKEIGVKGESKPVVIDGKGEYEIGDVYIRGIGGQQDLLNTIYTVSFEGVSLCHLGAFGGVLGPELKEEIGKVDVLFVPIIQGGLLGAARPPRLPSDMSGTTEAVQIAANIEPRIVMPMRYEAVQLKNFLKEFGSGETKPVDKLTLKKKDLTERKTEVIVLEPVV